METTISHIRQGVCPTSNRYAFANDVIQLVPRGGHWHPHYWPEISEEIWLHAALRNGRDDLVDIILHATNQEWTESLRHADIIELYAPMWDRFIDKIVVDAESVIIRTNKGVKLDGYARNVSTAQLYQSLEPWQQRTKKTIEGLEILREYFDEDPSLWFDKSDQKWLAQNVDKELLKQGAMHILLNPSRLAVDYLFVAELLVDVDLPIIVTQSATMGCLLMQAAMRHFRPNFNYIYDGRIYDDDNLAAFYPSARVQKKQNAILNLLAHCPIFQAKRPTLRRLIALQKREPSNITSEALKALPHYRPLSVAAIVRYLKPVSSWHELMPHACFHRHTVLVDIIQTERLDIMKVMLQQYRKIHLRWPDDRNFKIDWLSHATSLAFQEGYLMICIFNGVISMDLRSDLYIAQKVIWRYMPRNWPQFIEQHPNIFVRPTRGHRKIIDFLMIVVDRETIVRLTLKALRVYFNPYEKMLIAVAKRLDLAPQIISLKNLWNITADVIRRRRLALPALQYSHSDIPQNKFWTYGDVLWTGIAAILWQQHIDALLVSVRRRFYRTRPIIRRLADLRQTSVKPQQIIDAINKI